MSVLASYRRLFALTGTNYLIIAFIARLPLAMAQIGTLLLVREVTGSYGAGGAAAGALAIANAVASPIAGTLGDRIGQRPVLIVQSIGASIGLAVLVFVSAGDAPVALLIALCAWCGIFLPQVGALARVRWRELAKRSGNERLTMVSAAFSYEGAADEASFVLGPAIIGTAVALVSPGGALLLAAVLVGVFGLGFAVHPTVAVVPGHRGDVVAHQGSLLRPVLIFLALGQLLVGAVFGSVQTGTTALATQAGEPGLAGILHAVLGIGSVVAGLLLAALPARWKLANRLPVFAAALVLLATPLLLVNSVWSLALVLLVFGIAVAPYMITIFAATEQVTEPHRLGAAMMILAAATSLGYAIGSSTAGRLADSGGYTTAYMVTIGAAAVALILSIITRASLLRAPEPRTSDSGPDVA